MLKNSNQKGLTLDYLLISKYADIVFDRPGVVRAVLKRVSQLGCLLTHDCLQIYLKRQDALSKDAETVTKNYLLLGHTKPKLLLCLLDH